MGYYKDKYRNLMGGEKPANSPQPPPGPSPQAKGKEIKKDPVSPPNTAANKGNWDKKKVELIDGSFLYWEAKSGTSIFVDEAQIENVTLLTPAVARKLFPS